ncbi:MAG: OsmC family protein [Candidatus Dormibacteraeota bacterium]|uniref:OsmC family protein n=2 Tax=Candidatus Aeolococcus gillhamiae TaxID=3127015 RepID=A0A2W5ZLT2_9BACT|nr:OsmC family protein [Candidatus Dormibacteraeota bacterium]PZR83776.1 MAG: osmotically inducible protein C [Candidatus Dormibacter sp. RRmetagenome_bin12]
MMFRVETRTLDGQTTAVGGAGPHSVIVDRPIEAGGGGRGFNGGQLLHLAVAGCVSNDLFREAARSGITLSRVVVIVDGDFEGDPPVSTGITYQVDVEGDASTEDLDALVRHVDEIAEIPNSLRRGTAVKLRSAKVH